MIINNETPEYISVGELSEGFSENMMEPTSGLIGMTLSLYFESGKEMQLTFMDIETMKYRTVDREKEERLISSYLAINPRENIYFIDFVASYGDTRSVSIVVDMNKDIATVITGILPTTDDMSIPILKRAEQGLPLTPVQALIEHALVNTPYKSAKLQHEKTTELIGKRVQFIYSSKDIYEHIYLNENMYTWHCISGSEKGLSDTDKCFYYKIDEDLYLFIWIEKVIPTMGIVVEDLNTLRSYGKIYGYENYSVGKVTNFPVGSYAKIINR